jgi:hypothetical protein
VKSNSVTKAELVAYAEKYGVWIDGSDTKAQIINKLIEPTLSETTKATLLSFLKAESYNQNR